MEILTNIAKKILKEEYSSLERKAIESSDNYQFFTERIAELELALEDIGWIRLMGESEKEFSREGLKKINKLARIYFLNDPLIRRAVLTQTQYVFGQGFEIRADHPLIDEVIQSFVDDSKNKAEITEHQGRMIKETELQLFANIYFVFFVNKATGRVRVRTIPVDEIADIITDPEDSKTPLYYKRVWMKRTFDVATGQYKSQQETAYYPYWTNLKPAKTIAGKEVEDSVIYHIAVNRLSDMKFGVSEIYAAFNWSKAYGKFLEDWATIIRSYAKFAWGLTTKGRKGAAKVKDKLQSSIGTGENVYPPVAGSVFLSPEGAEGMKPIKTAGATTSANDGRRLLLMVCAATGIFEHYFGDPSTGNLATATAMERPMEMMFRDRQQLWSSVFLEIANFVIKQAVKAPGGKLHNSGNITKEDDQEKIVMANDVENEDPDLASKPISLKIDATFPPLLEKDIKERVTAIVSAATLDGKLPAGTLDRKDITKLLLAALGEGDIDETLKKMFPEDEPEEEESDYNKSFTKSVKELRKAASAIIEGKTTTN
jgi:hypothetical protein